VIRRTNHGRAATSQALRDQNPPKARQIRGNRADPSHSDRLITVRSRRNNAIDPSLAKLPDLGRAAPTAIESPIARDEEPVP
jgi:hypothetical protein